MGGLIDGVAGAFQFDESADGRLVEINQEVFGPLQASGQTVGGAVLFVAEPAAQPETLEDFLEPRSVGKHHFKLLPDLVPVIREALGADGQLFGRAFERKDGAGGGFFAGDLPACWRWCFGAEAQELAMFGETAVGRVEDQVVLMDASGDGLGAEFLEMTKKGPGVENSKFDFGFASHKFIVREE